METLLLTTEDSEIQKAAEIVKRGGLVAFPTETVYGLGADAFNPDSARKAYEAKGRPSDNPLIVHIASVEDLYRAASDVPHQALKLAEAFWPGPLTIVLPKRPEMPKETTGGLDTVALRMPNSDITLQLIKLSGTLLAGPSANVSGRPSPTSWLHVKNDLDGRIDAIICAGPCSGGIESTVLDLTNPDEPVILRPGLITAEMISAVLNTEVSYDKMLLQKPSEDPSFQPKSPGQKYKHYAPNAQMVVYEGEFQEVLRAIGRRILEEKAAGKKVAVIDIPNPRTFFAKLREYDALGKDIILVAAPCGVIPAESDFAGADGKTIDPGIYFSLTNRMLKAAGYNIIKVGSGCSEPGRKTMKIAIASDHGGFALKEAVKNHLMERGFELEDLGTHTEESVDYPVYGKKCAEYVASGQAELGIVVCGTGIGIGIAANKVKGIRCAELVTPFMAEMAKKHNHANMVSLGGRILSAEQAIELVDIWLDSEEEHGRHDRRVELLNEM